jgi:transcriptional regulator with XRE-family HTH domain
LSLASDTGDLPSEDVYLMKVHEKIKFMRLSKNWSQEKMAEKLNLSVNGYANIERGETDVQLSRLEKIAEILGVELLELFNFGEQNVVYLAYENNINFENHNQCKNLPSTAFLDEKKKLEHELDKTRRLLEHREQEVAYLKEIVELMKKGGG